MKVQLSLLLMLALAARLLAVHALGDGAPFGPDGTGATASLVLGGHPYPLHMALARAAGGLIPLSVAAGTLSCALLWAYGRALGLTGAGGWLLALLPLGIYGSALSAGDAPALALVLGGAWISTWGGPTSPRWHRVAFGLAGGLLAIASVAVKPVALPALVLLLPRPWSLLGLGVGLPWAAAWLRPLWAPKAGAGLLGSWWMASGGLPPSDPLSWLAAGPGALWRTEAWVGLGLIPLALLGAAWPRRAPEVGGRLRLAVLGPVIATLLVGAAFGDRLAPRYLEGPVIAALPWVGLLLPPAACLLLAWPAAALITQLAAFRAEADPMAVVPALPLVPGRVDAAALFAECSAPGATASRARAAELARTLPQGGTLTVEAQPDGREGELTWPLRVARPDLVIEVVAPSLDGG